ncbi:MAG: methyl-accepting chemotaxis protein [Sporomusaceae bacterium]|nr:methyl-accepting chemotaxis protein [Sporomusaceae bacterium]
MNIKKKLVIYILSLTMVMLLSICLFSYWNASKQLTRDININMDIIADQQAQVLDDWLVKKAKTLQDLAFVIQNTTNGEIPASYFKLDPNDKEISDIYIGFEQDGKFIHGESSPMPSDYDPRKRGWYANAKDKTGLIFSDPYIDATTKKFCVSPAIALKDSQGKLKGVMAEDILLETLTSIIEKATLNGKGYAYIIDGKGTILAHRDPQFIASSLADNEELKTIATKMLNTPSGNIEYTLQGKDMITVFRKIPSTGWTIAFTVSKAEIFEPLAQLRNVYLLIACLSLLLMGLATTYISRKIANPISNLTKNALLLADGDLRISVEVAGKDEVALLSQAFNQMGSNLRKLITEISSTADYLLKSASEMNHAAGEAGQVSEQIAITITDMAQAATKQSDVITSSADRVKEMANSVHLITSAAQKSNTTAGEAMTAIHEGNATIAKQGILMQENQKAVINVRDSITELAEKSSQIGHIIEVISNIADQTNLLALNAAIEAARAGEQGRGFAVVAEEVRKLAEQSNHSSKEIEQLIKDIQATTKLAVEEIALSNDIALDLEKASHTSQQSLHEINKAVQDFVVQIEHISTETTAVNENATEVSSSINEAAAVSESNAAATEEVAAASEEQAASVQSIFSETNTLLKQAETLKKEIQKFKI